MAEQEHVVKDGGTHEVEFVFPLDQVSQSPVQALVSAEQVAAPLVPGVRVGALQAVGFTGEGQSGADDDAVTLPEDAEMVIIDGDDQGNLPEDIDQPLEETLDIANVAPLAKLPEDPTTPLALEQVKDILLLCPEAQYMTPEQKDALAILIDKDQRILRNNRSVANKGNPMNAAYVICTPGPNGTDKKLEGKNGSNQWFAIPAPVGRIFGHSLLLGDVTILKDSTNSTLDLRVPETDSAGIRALAITPAIMTKFEKACPQGMLNFLRGLFETATDILAKEPQNTTQRSTSYGVSKAPAKLEPVLNDLGVAGEMQRVSKDTEIPAREGMIAIVTGGQFDINNSTGQTIRRCNVQSGAEEILFERHALGYPATATIKTATDCQVTYYNIKDLLEGKISKEKFEEIKRFWKTLFCSALHRRMS